HRITPTREYVTKAVELLLNSERPLIVCGQGALYSQAWNEILELAEILRIPVASTIAGKGCFPESHPLSVGVIGSRGGTSFSNDILSNADLVFFIGCNVDQVATDNWTMPKPGTKVIHLDISEAEVGNHLRTDLELIGDAKSTLQEIIDTVRAKAIKGTSAWVDYIKAKRSEYDSIISIAQTEGRDYVNPLQFIKVFERIIPKNYIIACDPGVGAIYTSTYFKVREGGRRILFNYSIGALGYSIPAAIGAYYANPNNTVFALAGDGSFGFTAGELETLSRLQPNVKIILFNNQSFGWIRASILMHYGPRYFATDFKPIDYVKIAEGFGLVGLRVSPEDLEYKIKEAIKIQGPTLIDVPVQPEDKLIPPVPSWASKAKALGYKYIY
ncbi:MAG: thiamine pyrophosphate-binding protein, partial [Desulfurococcaceae archaeon]